MADGTLAYRFVSTQPGGERAIAVWNPVRDVAVSLDLEATKATLINAVGEAQETKATAGKVSVQLNRGSPAYLIWK